MILVIGTVRIAPEKIALALPAMDKMATASRAEAGCLEYTYAQDVFDPKIIHVIEKWSDENSLDAHFNTEQLREWRASWAEIGITDRNLMAFKTGAGTPL